MTTESIRVFTNTKKKLEELKRPGQSLAGVVEELVKFHELARPKRKPRPVNYRGAKATREP